MKCGQVRVAYLVTLVVVLIPTTGLAQDSDAVQANRALAATLESAWKYARYGSHLWRFLDLRPESLRVGGTACLKSLRVRHRSQ